MSGKSGNETGQLRKKVICLCVDSLLVQAIERGFGQNKLPALRLLAEKGRYYRDVVSAFPTMSVTIDSTMLTGTYPDEHRVPGLVWYAGREQRLVNYGTGPMEIARHGVNDVLADAMIRLNGSHLSPNVKTLYEELAERGLTSGSVNGLIYRGAADHTLNIPAWLDLPTALPRQIDVKAPDLFAFGAFADPLGGVIKLPDGLTGRLGFSNAYAAEVVKHLIKMNALPDFLYVYFTDLDRKLHTNGPGEMEGVIEADKQIQSLLDAFGSPERALQMTVILVIGDSGVSRILPSGEQPVIELRRLLDRFAVMPTGSAVTGETEIVLAVNETMAYIYKLKPQTDWADIVESLKADPRIDIIARRDGGWITVVRAGTSDTFAYRAQGKFTDPYRQSWTVDDNPDVLDLTLDTGDGSLRYGRYPDVLRRLHAALHSHEGDYAVVTARPGYELADSSSPTHKGGGGHGSLGIEESLIPLIVCGTDEQPEFLRLVDLKPFLLRLLANR